MRKLRAGVIGVGYLGSFHAQKYQQIDGVELVAIADNNSDRLSEVCQRLKVPGVLEYSKLLNKVDLVSIVVPPAKHYEIGVFFLQNNVHCLIEKPLAENILHAQHLIEIAKKNNLILQVGHLERFNPMAATLKQKVTDAVKINTIRHSIFKERGTEVDVVLDSMIHDVDFILDFEHSKLANVEARGVSLRSNAIDKAQATLSFDSGLEAHLEANRVADSAKRQITIETSGYRYSIDFLTHEASIEQKSDRMPRTSKLIEKNSETPFSFNQLPEKIDILKNEIINFRDAIRFGKLPLVSGEDGKRALEVCLEIMDKIYSVG